MDESFCLILATSKSLSQSLFFNIMIYDSRIVIFDLKLSFSLKIFLFSLSSNGYSLRSLLYNPWNLDDEELIPSKPFDSSSACVLLTFVEWNDDQYSFLYGLRLSFEEFFGSSLRMCWALWNVYLIYELEGRIVDEFFISEKWLDHCPERS